jgi:hypothetical protein
LAKTVMGEQTPVGSTSFAEKRPSSIASKGAARKVEPKAHASEGNRITDEYQQEVAKDQAPPSSPASNKQKRVNGSTSAQRRASQRMTERQQQIADEKVSRMNINVTVRLSKQQQKALKGKTRAEIEAATEAYRRTLFAAAPVPVVEPSTIVKKIHTAQGPVNKPKQRTGRPRPRGETYVRATEEQRKAWEAKWLKPKSTKTPTRPPQNRSYVPRHVPKKCGSCGAGAGSFVGTTKTGQDGSVNYNGVWSCYRRHCYADTPWTEVVRKATKKPVAPVAGPVKTSPSKGAKSMADVVTVKTIPTTQIGVDYVPEANVPDTKIYCPCGEDIFVACPNCTWGFCEPHFESHSNDLCKGKSQDQLMDLFKINNKKDACSCPPGLEHPRVSQEASVSGSSAASTRLTKTQSRNLRRRNAIKRLAVAAPEPPRKQTREMGTQTMCMTPATLTEPVPSGEDPLANADEEAFTLTKIVNPLVAIELANFLADDEAVSVVTNASAPSGPGVTLAGQETTVQAPTAMVPENPNLGKAFGNVAGPGGPVPVADDMQYTQRVGSCPTTGIVLPFVGVVKGPFGASARTEMREHLEVLDPECVAYLRQKKFGLASTANLLHVLGKYATTWMTEHRPDYTETERCDVQANSVTEALKPTQRDEHLRQQMKDVRNNAAITEQAAMIQKGHLGRRGFLREQITLPSLSKST